jgi:hypothetical protein
LYVIDNFIDQNTLNALVDDMIARRGKQIILYPIAENIFSEMLLNSENLNLIRIQVFLCKKALLKNFEDFDNNLIFLAKLYSALKLKTQIYTLKFEWIFTEKFSKHL